jgi:low temperature requirement protein LtrA
MKSLLRPPEQHEARVLAVELFFDLVFVFAVTQLSHYLLQHLDAVGVLHTLVMFLAVWCLWIYTIWVTNFLDTDRKRVRLMLFALMAAAMFLAMSIEDAWGRLGLVFAGTYAASHVGRSLFITAALRGHNPANFRNFGRITIWLVAAAVFWIAGGLNAGDARLWLWLAALAFEYGGPWVYYYVPGLGRSSTSDWAISGSHMAERCGLFVIIALGESIIITGATAAELPWNWDTLIAFGAAFLGTVAMWWLYFNVGAVRGADRISHSGDPGSYARLAYTYLHMPIVAGIIASAAADELILAHPHGHLEPLQRALLVGGPALFLVGNLLFKRTSGQWFPLSHLVGLVLLALAALFSGGISPLALGAATSGVLLVTAIWETISMAPGERALDRKLRELRGK